MKSKIKNKDDEIVTRKILDEVLDEKFKEKLSNYPTRVEVEIMFEKWTYKIDENARRYRDEVLTKMDQIVGELAQMREDREFDRYDKRRTEEQFDDHEKRIRKLENQDTQ
jgi:hypothetical protein